MGAWIETRPGRIFTGLDRVAPYVGAWIETNVYAIYENDLVSHPTWVRGLKPAGGTEPPNHALSHPTWVRGLKRMMVVVNS